MAALFREDKFCVNCDYNFKLQEVPECLLEIIQDVSKRCAARNLAYFVFLSVNQLR